MANKTLNVRHQMKTDTSANWSAAVNFTPLAGEVIVYSDLNKIKIGDGVTKVNSLPFCYDAEIAAKYTKPASGIPSTDLASAVQTSLSKADTSVQFTSQSLTDPQKLQARTNIGIEEYTAAEIDALWGE